MKQPPGTPASPIRFFRSPPFEPSYAPTLTEEQLAEIEYDYLGGWPGGPRKPNWKAYWQDVVRSLISEVRRLKRLDIDVYEAAQHDRDCEEEGEGACCYRVWRVVLLRAGVCDPVSEEDRELLDAVEIERYGNG